MSKRQLSTESNQEIDEAAGILMFMKKPVYKRLQMYQRFTIIYGTPAPDKTGWQFHVKIAAKKPKNEDVQIL